MGGSMVGYRIYRIGKEGRFVGVHEVLAASDADAMLQAHKLLDGSDLEVWRGNEKIGYLRAVQSTSEFPPAVIRSSNTDQPDPP
jgi:hypothetical protein